MLILIFYFLTLLLVSQTNTRSNNDYLEIAEKIFEDLQKEQSKKSTKFSIFPPSWEQHKGEYKSYIHFNFQETEVRNLFKIPDENMFVTNFVVSSLLEAYEFKAVKESSKIKFNKDDFFEAVKSIIDYQDKNVLKNQEDAPVYRFWPQKLVNGTWIAYPTNLKEPLKHFPSTAHAIEWALKFIGLKKWSQYLKDQEETIERMIAAFEIPPDVDDAFVNIALLAFLKKYEKDFPKSADLFMSKNKNFDALFERVVKYSYRPFLNCTNSNTEVCTNKIDPRTFYYLSDFLHKMKKESSPEELKRFKLPATWLMNIDEVRKLFPLEGMPFNVNNVDSNVVTNFLFGMTNFLLYQDPAIIKKYVTQDLLDIYKNSAKLIAWGYETREIEVRTDLALTYYPSIFDGYWFSSRTLHALLNHEEEFLFPEMNEVMSILNNVLKEHLTNSLFDYVSYSSDKKYAYFDDFLGNYGGKIRGEDRLFSTALGIQTFLDTWTKRITSEEGISRKWEEETPEKVKDLVQKLIDYLVDHILKKEKAIHQNCFFSGSAKGLSSLPFFYPGNYYEYLDGTKISEWPPQKTSYISNDLSIAMEGYVEESVYDQWKELKFFGLTPPKEMESFAEETFPYWSAPSLTYATAFLAVSKFVSIIE